jgi:hypothetical protein
MAIWAVLIPSVLEIINKVIPDPAAAAEAKLKVLDLQQKGELAQLDADVRLALGQMDINKAEAESPDFFRGGWRPGAGWICVFGLGYTFVIRPLLPWCAAVLGLSPPPLPPIDTGELLALLFGMLGLGAMRTKERIEGKA